MCLANPIYNAGRQDEGFGFEQLDWQDTVEDRSEENQDTAELKPKEVEKA